MAAVFLANLTQITVEMYNMAVSGRGLDGRNVWGMHRAMRCISDDLCQCKPAPVGCSDGNPNGTYA